MAGKFWTQAWSVVTGCEPISAGCANCWAARELSQKPVLKAFHARGVVPRYQPPHELAHREKSCSPVRLHPEVLNEPYRWMRPRRVAVAFLADLFHEDVEDHWRDRVLDRVEPNGQHRYLLLTKRSALAQAYFAHLDGELGELAVWLGVTGEDQKHATQRLADLAITPAPHRWLIAEPLLGPMEIGRHLEWLEWVVVGAETGPGARPCDPRWVVDIVEQCRSAGVPVWVKACPPMPDLDGELHRDQGPREMPVGLRLPGEEW